MKVKITGEYIALHPSHGGTATAICRREIPHAQNTNQPRRAPNRTQHGPAMLPRSGFGSLVGAGGQSAINCGGQQRSIFSLPKCGNGEIGNEGAASGFECNGENVAPHKYLKTWTRMRPADPFRSSAQTTEVRRNRTRPTRDLLTSVHRARCFGWGKKEIGPTGGPCCMIHARTR
jgi:hypothetical protein